MVLDTTRHRKITALNAIGMWYKYYSYMNKHFTVDDASTSLIVNKKPGHRKRMGFTSDRKSETLRNKNVQSDK